MVAAAPGLPEALATRTGTLLLALATGEWSWWWWRLAGAVVVGLPGTVVVVVGAAAEPEVAGAGVWIWPRRRTAARTNSPRRMAARSIGTLGPERSGGWGSGAEGSSTPASLPTPGWRSKHSRTAGRGPVHWGGFPQVGDTPV